MARSTTSAPEPYSFEDAPRDVLAIVPLLYVAWADGVLTPTEIEEMHERLAGQSWIDPAH